MARSAERFPCRSIQIQRKYEAKFDKGLLRIKSPKPAEVAKKRQKIEIKKA